MADTLPTRVGRYEIRRELGRGMMGIVYEAHDPALGRTIALKTIQLGFVPSDEERQAFERRFVTEARVAGQLSHPGIVVVHDVGRDVESGTLYIALERLQGQTLDQAVAGGRALGWREALGLVRRVAEALHHAHENGVIHRDIKPANIMVLPSGEPKIMDFGIARAPTSQLTSTGQLFGTPSFMSPEQARGGLLDNRCDLFSAGAVLYMLLTGQKPFAGTNVPDILSRVIYKDPTPPSHIVRTLPPEVDYLVARALSKSPDDRYRDGRSMAEDIDDVLAGRPPRHRSSWRAPAPADGTMVSARIPIPQPEGTHADLALEPVGGEAAPKVAPRRSAYGAAVVVGLVLGVALAYVAMQQLAPPAAPTVAAPPALAPPPTTAAETPAEAAPEAATPEAAPTPEALTPEAAALQPAPPEETPLEEVSRTVKPEVPPPAPRERTPPVTAPAFGRLALDFEHGLKSGTLRVWVDDELVLEQELDSQVKTKVLALKLRKGAVKDVMEVKPGRHEVRVRLAWDDNEKTETIAGTFKAGATRRLEVRLGRIRKKLSLEWR